MNNVLNFIIMYIHVLSEKMNRRKYTAVSSVTLVKE